MKSPSYRAELKDDHGHGGVRKSSSSLKPGGNEGNENGVSHLAMGKEVIVMNFSAVVLLCS